MDNHDSGVSVYAEAKNEYTKQLAVFIVPTFHRFFIACLTQASEEENNHKRQLWKFQELLSQIPEWNMDKVQREVQKFIADIQCDYLEELVTAVFIAHTKVLTAIRIGNKNKRVQITIPKLDHFLHRALSECSRLLWSSAYLFHNELSPIEKQKNHRQIEGLIHEGVGQAIRGLLPVKNILKDYLSDPNEADAEDEKDEKDEVAVTAVPEESPAVPVVSEPVQNSELPEIPESVKNLENSDLSENSKVVQVQESQIPEVADVKIPEPQPVTESVPEPLAQPQTLVIDTEPSVRFTNYDQVIKESGDNTSIQYVENTADNEEGIEFVDDTYENLSDFEDLTEHPNVPLTSDDYETL